MTNPTLPQPTPQPNATAKTPRPCAGCGELAGSISAGTGYPVVRERATGRYYHVRCRPGNPAGAVLLAL